MLLEIIHAGHEINKAFNSKNGLPQTVIYCVTCAGDFHGCYCETLSECINCEPLEKVEM